MSLFKPIWMTAKPNKENADEYFPIISMLTQESLNEVVKRAKDEEVIYSARERLESGKSICEE